MKDASQYPITQLYGYDPTYPLNNGFHKGVDYGAPEGTPVLVNGVQIGLVGHTGAAFGPHLHVGRFVNGSATDPGQHNGFTLDIAVVYDTGYDATNGNFVRINGSGALWVYLHLSRIDVQKGQLIKGGIVKPTEQQIREAFLEYNGTPTPQQVSYYLDRESGYLYRDLLGADRPSADEVKQAFQKHLKADPTPVQLAYYPNRSKGILYQDLANAEPNSSDAKLQQIKTIVNS